MLSASPSVIGSRHVTVHTDDGVRPGGRTAPTAPLPVPGDRVTHLPLVGRIGRRLSATIGP